MHAILKHYKHWVFKELREVLQKPQRVGPVTCILACEKWGLAYRPATTLHKFTG